MCFAQLPIAFQSRFQDITPVSYTHLDVYKRQVFKLHITHGFFVAIGAYIFLVNALEATDPRWRAAFGVAAAITAANVLVVEGRIGYLILAVLMIYLFVQHFRWRGVLALSLIHI